MLFACLELLPAFRTLAFSTRLIPIGGVLSGFFGGLSGHQGALRTAFLLRAGLDKTSLVATAVLSAVIVDVSRLIIYGATFTTKDLSTLQSQGTLGLVIAGSLSAFMGSFLGSRLLRTITLQWLKIFMAVMLILLSIALGIGLI